MSNPVRSEQWQFLNDVSVQFIGSTLKGRNLLQIWVTNSLLL